MPTLRGTFRRLPASHCFCLLKIYDNTKQTTKMSGGHFQYQQYRIEDIAVEIGEMIGSNDDQSLDEWGQLRGNNYPPEILEKFREAAHTLRQAAEMAHRVDWLVSGDDGEESFMRRWEKEVRTSWNNDKDLARRSLYCE